MLLTKPATHTSPGLIFYTMMHIRTDRFITLQINYNHSIARYYLIFIGIGTQLSSRESLFTCILFCNRGYLPRAFSNPRLGLSLLLFIHSFSISIYSLFLPSAPDHNVGDISLSPRSMGTPYLKSGDLFSLSQRSHSKGCPWSQTRRFFSRSAPDHTARAPQISN